MALILLNIVTILTCIFVYTTVNQLACGSFTWINGVTYTASNNTATQLLQTTAGCDSLVSLNLTINQPSSGT